MPTSKETVCQQLLLVRCQRGDREAMEELIAVWEKRLFYYVRRIVDQEADAWDVKSRLHCAKRALRKLMEKEGKR